MERVTQERLVHILQAGLNGAVCVDVWIGHGNSLSVGFGSEVLPLPVQINAAGEKPRFKHFGKAPIEIKTSISRWSIDLDGEVVDIDGDFDSTERASQSLRGRRVIEWNLNPDSGVLYVAFSDNASLTIERISTGIEAGDVLWELWQRVEIIYEYTESGEVNRLGDSEPAQ